MVQNTQLGLVGSSGIGVNNGYKPVVVVSSSDRGVVYFDGIAEDLYPSSMPLTMTYTDRPSSVQFRFNTTTYLPQTASSGAVTTNAMIDSTGARFFNANSYFYKYLINVPHTDTYESAVLGSTWGSGGPYDIRDVPLITGTSKSTIMTFNSKIVIHGQDPTTKKQLNPLGAFDLTSSNLDNEPFFNAASNDTNVLQIVYPTATLSDSQAKTINYTTYEFKNDENCSQSLPTSDPSTSTESFSLTGGTFTSNYLSSTTNSAVRTQLESVMFDSNGDAIPWGDDNFGIKVAYTPTNAGVETSDSEVNVSHIYSGLSVNDYSYKTSTFNTFVDGGTGKTKAANSVYFTIANPNGGTVSAIAMGRTSTSYISIFKENAIDSNTAGVRLKPYRAFFIPSVGQNQYYAHSFYLPQGTYFFSHSSQYMTLAYICVQGVDGGNSGGDHTVIYISGDGLGQLGFLLYDPTKEFTWTDSGKVDDSMKSQAWFSCTFNNGAAGSVVVDTLNSTSTDTGHIYFTFDTSVVTNFTVGHATDHAPIYVNGVLYTA